MVQPVSFLRPLYGRWRTHSVSLKPKCPHRYVNLGSIALFFGMPSKQSSKLSFKN